jgi:hypothetical protein
MTSLTGQYFLNHRLQLDEIEWQVRELIEAGYEGIYPHARQGLLTPYMSEDWWKVIDKILDGCRKHGGEMWIWDEDYFPSGLSGGRVVWDDPGLIARGVAFTVKEVSGAGPFEADFDAGMLLRAFAVAKDNKSEIIDITPFCGTRRQEWTSRYVRHGAYSPMITPVGNPHWRDTMTENRFAAAWTPSKPGDYLIIGCVIQKQGGVHPDMLNPRSVQRFLEINYQPYYDRYKNEFGKLIKGAFTDEPSPGGFLYPWTPRFAEEFQADHGYDVRDHLAHLAIEIDDRTPLVRHHYRLTQHRLQKANYVDQISQWCRSHNIQFAGHLTRTEWLSVGASHWPNELRCYQQMDIPCADPLGSACAWKNAAAYHTGLKVVSSVSHLFGQKQAGSDALAVIGDEANLRELKFMLDYQMVLGINYFVIHGLSYSLDGPRKDEVPPSIFYQHTQWKHMAALSEHIITTCETLSQGQHVCELALLYPSTSLECQFNAESNMWHFLPDEKLYHQTVEELLSHQKDFDLIDEVTLGENVKPDGSIATREKYRVIILPYLRWIENRTAQALLRFAKAGGRVIVVGFKPQTLGETLDKPAGISLDSPIEFYESLTADVLKSIPGFEVQGDGARDIFVLQRKLEDKTITFAVNRREQPFAGTIEGQTVHIEPLGSTLFTQGKAEVLPAVSVSAKELAQGWSVTFEPNHVPLNFWHITRDSANREIESLFPEVTFDFMLRQADPAGEGSDFVRYTNRFMLTGEIPDARIVMDESGISGDWTVCVNNHPVKEWTKKTVYDCRNLEAQIGKFLQSDSTPTLNIITIEARGANRGLREMPYLYGTFTCEYRYSHLSFPFLKGIQMPISPSSLQPWAIWGYPTFSGSAVYRNNLTIEKEGRYWLDLGQVEDVAAVSLDGKKIKTLAWPAYRCELGTLAPGRHELAVEITNSPANRNRAMHQLSGLLGPVRIWSE